MNQINPQYNLEYVALTRAMKQVESGGDYQARGASGEFGAYQYMPATWKNYAGKYLGNSGADISPQNQDKVAYSFVEEKAKQGATPAQIVSMWNAGEGRPNAYQNNVGVNSQGVRYDTPAHVKKVLTAYSQIIPNIKTGTGGGSYNSQAPTQQQQVQRNGLFRQGGPKEGTMLNQQYMNNGRSVHGGQGGKFLAAPVKEIMGGVGDVVRNIGARGQNIGETWKANKAGEQGVGSSLWQTLGQVVGMASDTIGNVVMTGLEAATPEFLERPISKGVNAGAEALVNSKVGQDIQGWVSELEQEKPEAYRNLMASLPIAELGLNVVTGYSATAITPAVRKTTQNAFKKAIRDSLDDALSMAAGNVDEAWGNMSSMTKGVIKRGLAGDEITQQFKMPILQEMSDAATTRAAKIAVNAMERNNNVNLKKAVSEWGARNIEGYVPGRGDLDAMKGILKDTLILEMDDISNGGKINFRNVLARSEAKWKKLLDGADEIMGNQTKPVDPSSLGGYVRSAVDDLLNSNAVLGGEAATLADNAIAQFKADMKQLGVKLDDAGNITTGQQIAVQKLYKKFKNYPSSSKNKTDEVMRKAYRKMWGEQLDPEVADTVNQLYREASRGQASAKVLKNLDNKKLSDAGLATTISILGGIGMAGGGFNPLLYQIGSSLSLKGYTKIMNILSKRLETSGSTAELIKMGQAHLDELTETMKKLGIQDEITRKTSAGDPNVPQLPERAASPIQQGPYTPPRDVVPDEGVASQVRRSTDSQDTRNRNIFERKERAASDAVNSRKTEAKVVEDITSTLSDKKIELKELNAIKKNAGSSINPEGQSVAAEVAEEITQAKREIKLLEDALKRIKNKKGNPEEIGRSVTPIRDIEAENIIEL